MAIPIFEVHVTVTVQSRSGPVIREIVVRLLAKDKLDAGKYVEALFEFGPIPYEITRVDDLTTG